MMPATPTTLEPQEPVWPADDEASAEQWRTLARRTRAIAEHWRRLFHAEEAKCAAADEKRRAAVSALRVAQQDRDLATRTRDEAIAARKLATQDKAQWKARSATQTSSKSFIALEATRNQLNETEVLLGSTQRALSVLKHEFDEFKADAERHETERDDAEKEERRRMAREAYDVVEEKRELQEQLDAMMSQLSEQLAASPPGALAKVQFAMRKQASEMVRLERTCHTLRAEAHRWRDRVHGSLASERLTQLMNGAPSSMMLPASPNKPLAILQRDRSAREDTPHALGLAKAKAAGASFASFEGEGDDGTDDAFRMRAQIDYWRAEAEHERTRQRAFQQAVWASDLLSQTQKQRVTALLRKPPAPFPEDPFGFVEAPIDSPRSERDTSTAPSPRRPGESLTSSYTESSFPPSPRSQAVYSARAVVRPNRA